MNNFLKFIGSMLALLFVGAVGYGMYTGFFSLARWMSGGLGDMAVFLLSVGGIMIVCSWIISAAIRSTAKKHKPANPDKVALYTRFVETIPQGEKADFSVFEKYMVLWGSNRLLVQFSVLQKLREASPMESKPVQTQIAKMLREMRRDTGESNIGITDSMLIKAVSKEVPANKASTSHNHMMAGETV
ncbi:MAG: hypothetical protein WBB45_15970 [Cyclobacteriaceae bacterium]